MLAGECRYQTGCMRRDWTSGGGGTSDPGIDALWMGWSWGLGFFHEGVARRRAGALQAGPNLLKRELYGT